MRPGGAAFRRGSADRGDQDPPSRVGQAGGGGGTHRVRGEQSRQITCLVEVDFTGARVGITPDDAEPFIEDLSGRPGVECRGLMTVAPLGEDPRRAFAGLRELRDRLIKRFPAVSELSMGMSEDLEAAVEEGATMVRVGSAIFGPRR